MVDAAAHVLIVTACTLLALIAYADIDAVVVVGILIAVCLAALATFIDERVWFAACTVFCVGTCALPVWACMLPVVACDAAYRVVCCASPRTRRAKAALVAVPCAAACVTAAYAAAHVDGPWSVDAWLLCALILVPLTVFMACAGWLRADGLRTQARYRALADAQRERLRLSHARINDVEAARANDMRGARLNERTRIAREIHDNVGHMLTRAIMMTKADQVVAASVGDDAHAAQFAEVGATLDEAMTMIRASVHDLKDEGTDFEGMIEDAAAVARHTPLRVHVDDRIRQAPSTVAHCFAAVIREALTNTVRHGTADEADVRLIDLPGLWQLVVQDNGGASVRRHGAPTGGIGLADIEERARALGGNATCGPYGTGWRVFVSVPKPADGRDGRADGSGRTMA